MKQVIGKTEAYQKSKPQFFIVKAGSLEEITEAVNSMTTENEGMRRGYNLFIEKVGCIIPDSISGQYICEMSQSFR